MRYVHTALLQLAVLLTFVTNQEASGAQPDFSTLTSALIQIRTYDGDQAITHGTGFFITEDGKLVTNFHVIENAVTNGYVLRGKFMDGDGSEEELDVWKVWPDRDLAVLYLRKPAKKLSIKPLLLTNTEPKSGETVWAMGYPLAQEVRATVTRGSVSGMRTIDELEALGGPMPHLSRQSSWVQMDVSINGGNSGGPVVDEGGRVVGVSTMARAGAQGMNFAINISPLKSTLEKLPSDPVGIAGIVIVPKMPVDTDKPREKGEAKRKPVRLPPIEISTLVVKQDLQPATLSETAKLFYEGVQKPCAACKGTRFINTQKTIRGERGNIGDVNRPRIVNERKDCTRCTDGTVSAPPDALKRMGDNIVNQLAKLAAETEKNADMRQRAFDRISTAIWFDRMRGGYGKASLRPLKKDQVGKNIPIMGYGYLLGETIYLDTRRFLVWVPDSDLVLLMDRPIYHDRPRSICAVVFCGTVTSSIDNPDYRVLVVQAGLIRTAGPKLDLWVP